MFTNLGYCVQLKFILKTNIIVILTLSGDSALFDVKRYCVGIWQYRPAATKQSIVDGFKIYFPLLDITTIHLIAPSKKISSMTNINNYYSFLYF